MHCVRASDSAPMDPATAARPRSPSSSSCAISKSAASAGRSSTRPDMATPRERSLDRSLPASTQNRGWRQRRTRRRAATRHRESRRSPPRTARRCHRANRVGRNCVKEGRCLASASAPVRVWFVSPALGRPCVSGPQNTCCRSQRRRGFRIDVRQLMALAAPAGNGVRREIQAARAAGGRNNPHPRRRARPKREASKKWLGD
jgi:hypothetical protein